MWSYFVYYVVQMYIILSLQVCVVKEGFRRNYTIRCLENDSVVRWAPVHSCHNMSLIEIAVRLHKTNSSVFNIDAVCVLILYEVQMCIILSLQVSVVNDSFSRNFTRLTQFCDDQCCKLLCLCVHVYVSQTLIEICTVARPVLHNLILMCSDIRHIMDVFVLWLCSSKH